MKLDIKQDTKQDTKQEKHRTKTWNKYLALFGLCAVLGITGCGNKEIKEAYETAAAALEEGDYETAETGFQTVAETEEMLPEAYRGLGIAQFNQGKYAEACIALSKSLLYLEDENVEFETDVKSYLAAARMKREEYEEAIKLYDELIQTDKNAEYYFLRGKCYINTGDYESAKTDFDQAAEKSDDYMLFLNIYEIYDELQMNADGSAYLEQALKLVSENDYYSRGLIHYYLQDYTKAKEVLIKAINADQDAKAMMLLGKVYLSLDDAANARAMYQEHINDPKLAPEAYNGLALCDIAEESYTSALENIQKGLEYGDTEVKQSLLFNEICVYEYLKEWSTARTKASEYVQMYPGDEAGAREYAFLNH